MASLAYRERERIVIGWLQEFLNSVFEMCVVSTPPMREEVCSRETVNVPAWVENIGQRFRTTLFSPPNRALSGNSGDHYEMGYSMGIAEWGFERMKKLRSTVPAQLRGRLKLTAGGRRRVGKVCEDYLIRCGYPGPGTPGSRYIPRKIESWLRHSSVPEKSRIHRGQADGLKGMGPGSEANRSTDATDAYLLMVLNWRRVEKMNRTELHRMLIRWLGPRAGDLDRTRKLCQRIGFRGGKRGRPKKNRTLAT